MNTHYDLIVVGGGMTGAAAAIAAGRRGLRTLLIEKTGVLGGAMHTMFVTPFMSYAKRMPGTLERETINKGIFIEIVNELKAMENGLIARGNFNAEFIKVLLDRKCAEAGVTVLFHAYFSGVTAEGEHITSLSVSTRIGTLTFTADTYIDCSGDAMVAFAAGCPYHIGREEDSACQPMTLCFRMGGVNLKRFRATIAKTQALYKKFQTEGKIKNPRENILHFIHTSENVLHLNSTRIIGKSTLDPFEMSKAEVEAREQMMELYHFLKEYAPGCKRATLLSSATEIGVRESRMIEGDYTVTSEELLSCKQFADSIAVGSYEVDIHSPDGSGTVIKKVPVGKHYTIPYGALLPQKADNLLVAGRCISSTHEAQSAYRIIPICCNIGEAAGLAAVLKKESGSNLRSISMDTLHRMMEENNLLY